MSGVRCQVSGVGVRVRVGVRVEVRVGMRVRVRARVRVGVGVRVRRTPRSDPGSPACSASPRACTWL